MTRQAARPLDVVYRISLPPQVADAITHLPPSVKHDAKQALRILSREPHAGEALERDLEGLWKYRIRSFRVVYRIVAAERFIHILAIGHRDTIYDAVRSLLRFSTRR